MAKTLVVVESPAKAKTIKKYLGSKYEVLASKGHIKDLPKKLGIDIEQGFKETYEVVPGKEKVLAELKSAAKGADEILLATDPDREGEAIAWHLAEELKQPQEGDQAGRVPRDHEEGRPVRRRATRASSTSTSTTRSARAASSTASSGTTCRRSCGASSPSACRPGACRASPSASSSTASARSRRSSPRSTGTAARRSRPTNGADHPFLARLASRGRREARRQERRRGRRRPRPPRAGAATASRRSRRASASATRPRPTRTSKLQQDAVNRLGFGAKRTMQIAQGLYEGVDLGKDGGAGRPHHVHAHRLDAPLARRGRRGARAHRRAGTARRYVPAQPNVFKSKKNAQDAHEAIRPTSLELHARERAQAPEGRPVQALQADLGPLPREPDDARRLRPDERRHRGRSRTDKTVYGLRASGRILKFSGWLEAYGKGEIPKAAAPLAGEGEGERPTASRRRRPRTSWPTTPRRRCPSSRRAQTLHLVTPAGRRDRAEVHAAARRATTRARSCASSRSAASAARARTPRSSARCRRATTSRRSTARASARRRSASSSSTASSKSELDFMDPAFTSKMEEELDEVEAGKEKRVDLLKRFYKRFRSQLDKSKKLKRWNPEPEPTDEKCDDRRRRDAQALVEERLVPRLRELPRVQEHARPRRRTASRAPPRETGIDCDKCGKPMVIRSGRYGEFLSCTGYPECKNAQARARSASTCPKCGGRPHRDPPEEARRQDVLRLLELPERSHQVRLQAVAEAHRRAVPELRRAVPRLRRARSAKPMIACANKECGYKRPVGEPETAAPPAQGEQAPAAL